MNLTIKLTIDKTGEDHMRSVLTEVQPEPAEGQVKKTDADWTRVDIETYLTDRNIDLLGNYFKVQAEKKAAHNEAKNPSVRSMKKQLEAAPANVQAQVADLLKNVVVTDGTVGKGV